MLKAVSKCPIAISLHGYHCALDGNVAHLACFIAMRPYKLSISAVLAVATSCAPAAFALSHASLDASSSPPMSIYIDANDNFQTALTAAMMKKQVPVTVVTAKETAAYTLHSSEVAAKEESGASKIARCAFAYCAGINGMSSVSVQLIRNSDGAIVWAYQVRKGNAGPGGVQSLSEAIAKHLRNDYLDKQK